MDKTWKELATCRSTSFNVQDLLPDREYKFRVRAINVYGTSEPSQESELTAVGEKPEGRLSSLYHWLEISVHDLPCVCRNPYWEGGREGLRTENTLMMAGRVLGDLDFQGCDADPYFRSSTYDPSKNIEPAVLVYCHQGVIAC